MPRIEALKSNQLLAEGRTAQIYAWEDGWVLKLFHGWMPRRAVETEAWIAGLAADKGFGAPRVREVVEIGDRLGLVYQRLDGPSLLNRIGAHPWKMPAYARLLANLQAEMHARSAPELPPLNERLARKVQTADLLPDDLKAAALLALERLPGGDRLCHGDFHPDNILLTRQGPVIIDWTDAACGNPLADVARTSLLFSISSLPPSTPGRRVVESFREWFHRLYLRRYFQLSSAPRSELAAWMPVVAAARLSEQIPGEAPRLLQIVRGGLSVRG
jgi:uncharacterized protein (TIGR02172 family)